MEELIFFGIIIALSIFESIARSRRAKAKRESGEAPPEQFEWAQQTPTWEDEIPSYDQDPSYDEAPSYDDQVATYDETAPPAQPRRAHPPRSGSDQPGDVWAEIAGLASGTKERADASAREAPRAPVQRTPAPRREPPVRRDDLSDVEEALSVERRRARELTQRRAIAPRGPHAIHLAHAGYGTDPSERAPSEQDLLDPLAERLNPTAREVRSQLRSLSPGALRQAFVLKEVLEPPVTLRE